MTAQIPDEIFVDGASRPLCVLPLDILFEAMPNPPRFDETSTANWRGYLAKWKIEKDQLWLTGLEGKIDRTPRGRWDPAADQGWAAFNRTDPRKELASMIAQIDGLMVDPKGNRLSDANFSGRSIFDSNGLVDLEKATGISAKRLFESSTEPLPASWYTGLLRIPDGKLLNYLHAGFGSEYERDIVIQIDGGFARRHWIIDNKPRYALREQH